LKFQLVPVPIQNRVKVPIKIAGAKNMEKISLESLSMENLNLHDHEDEENESYTSEDLIHFKNLLLKKRFEIIEEAKSTVCSGKINLDTNEMKDEVDLASLSIAHEITFRLLDRSRKLLGEIERALQKIDNGEYGYCEGTGETIPRKRLELAPWVRHGVEHKSQLEKIKKLAKKGQKREEEYLIAVEG
jgi:DnaK suppressor protein